MRSRHQDGWIEERGTRQRIWYGHYYSYLTDLGTASRTFDAFQRAIDAFRTAAQQVVTTVPTDQ